MTIVVIGATGTVGREVVRALVERRAQVRALVRSTARARATLPSCIELVPGDAGDHASLDAALRGAHAVFYVSPHEPDEERLARTVVAACESAGARLVFLGVHADGANRFARACSRLFVSAILPRYAPKLRLSEHVRTSRARPVVLLASNFFQNDELFLDELLSGEFVCPIGSKGINRVDVRDVGDAAARVLLDPTFPEGAFPVIGPESLVGEACAATWARMLGRDVRYTGEDLARFEIAARRALAGKKLDDILASFGAIRRLRIPTDPAQLAATTSLLGRPPRAYATYVSDVAMRASQRRLVDDLQTSVAQNR